MGVQRSDRGPEEEFDRWEINVKEVDDARAMRIRAGVLRAERERAEWVQRERERAMVVEGRACGLLMQILEFNYLVSS